MKIDLSCDLLSYSALNNHDKNVKFAVAEYICRLHFAQSLYHPNIIIDGNCLLTATDFAHLEKIITFIEDIAISPLVAIVALKLARGGLVSLFNYFL